MVANICQILNTFFFMVYCTSNSSFNLLFHIHVLSLNSRFENSGFAIKCREKWYNLYLLLVFVVTAELSA
jgi:hypothetical protein